MRRTNIGMNRVHSKEDEASPINIRHGLHSAIPFEELEELDLEAVDYQVSTTDYKRASNASFIINAPSSKIISAGTIIVKRRCLQCNYLNSNVEGFPFDKDFLKQTLLHSKNNVSPSLTLSHHVI
jgi:hypothetical protein